MILDFDIKNLTATEFGVGRDDGNGQTFVSLPVDANVQNALRDIVSATWQAMRKDADDPPRYEPSEKHGSTEYLHLPLNDEGCEGNYTWCGTGKPVPAEVFQVLKPHIFGIPGYFKYCLNIWTGYTAKDPSGVHYDACEIGAVPRRYFCEIPEN